MSHGLQRRFNHTQGVAFFDFLCRYGQLISWHMSQLFHPRSMTTSCGRRSLHLSLSCINSMVCSMALSLNHRPPLQLLMALDNLNLHIPTGSRLINCWILAKIFKETLREVCNIPHSLPLQYHLASRFNTASVTRALDLKCVLTNVSKGPRQSMEDCLHHIKTLIDSLATVQSLVYNLELTQFTTSG